MSQVASLPRPIKESPAVSSAAMHIGYVHDSAYASHRFGTPGSSGPLNELTSVASAHGLLDCWPGQTTYQQARIFLALLPSGVRAPEFSVDPDGEIAVEWYDGDDVLSISMGHTGRLAYVYERNGEVSSGTGFSSSANSGELLEMIKTFR
jgi:hypothetical protein